jgi:hypothetical protein
MLQVRHDELTGELQRAHQLRRRYRAALAPGIAVLLSTLVMILTQQLRLSMEAHLAVGFAAFALTLLEQLQQ